MGDWSIVLPLEGNNLLDNPSGERGTAGWGSIAGAQTLVGTVAGTAVFGVYSAVVSGGGVNLGAHFGTFTTGVGTAYRFSTYIQGPVGSQYRIEILNGAFGDRAGSITLTADGSWHPYYGSFIESSGGTRLLTVSKIQGSAGNDPFFVDGIRVQVGTAFDTYVDGDQDGCQWLGNPHYSPSVRSAQSRAGGTIVPLNDLGLTVLESDGVGMPPVENIAQPYAQLNGAFYQRTRTAVRPFTLVVQASGTTLPGLYALRQRAIDTIKPDLVTPQQPARFLYTGAGGTTQIDAFYDGGLERANRDGFSEKIAWRFASFDPYWSATTDKGTSLPALAYTGSMNHIAYRDPNGRWGTFGSAVNGSVRALAEVNTTLYVGGTFTQAGGTTAFNITTLRSGVFGTIPAGTLNGAVNAIAPAPDGTTYVVGEFSSVGASGGGAHASRRITYLTPAGTGFLTPSNGTWGTFGNGANGPLFGAVIDFGGTLHVGGSFSQIASPGDTLAGTHGAFWTKTAWGTFANGPQVLTVPVQAVRRDGVGRPYFGGSFFVGNNTGGAFRYNGDSFGLVALRTDATIYDVLSLPDGRNVFAGAFSTASQGTVSRGSARFLAWFNDVQYTALGTNNSPNNTIRTMAYDGTRLFVGGLLTAAGSEGASGIASLIYPQWIPRELFANPTPTVLTLLRSTSGTLYAGFDRVTNGTVATFTTIAAPANAAASPLRVVFRAPSSGTTRLLHLINTTTGGALYFNLSLLASEVATLVLAPGSVSFTSSLRGNVISSILPMSNPARWTIAPGNNLISFFADNSGLQTDLVYRPSYWSADSTV